MRYCCRKWEREWKPIWRSGVCGCRHNTVHFCSYQCTPAIPTWNPLVLRLSFPLSSCILKLTFFLILQATVALILGYSWVDGHFVQVISPGVGWSVAWKRAVLVLIGRHLFSRLEFSSCWIFFYNSGSAASFIIMMLPPTSGRKAVRMRNASSITNLSNMYTFLISVWIASKHKTAPNPTWILSFRTKLMAIGSEVGSIRELTQLARWEGSIRGSWPVEEYMQLAAVQSEMIASLAQVGLPLLFHLTLDLTLLISLAMPLDNLKTNGVARSSTPLRCSTRISFVYFLRSCCHLLMITYTLDFRCDVGIRSGVSFPSHRRTDASSFAHHPPR